MIKDQIIAIENQDGEITNLIKSELIYAIIVREKSLVFLNKLRNNEMISYFKNEKTLNKCIKELSSTQGCKKLQDFLTHVIKQEGDIDRDMYIVPEYILFVEPFGEHGSKISLDIYDKTIITTKTNIEDVFNDF